MKRTTNAALAGLAGISLLAGVCGGGAAAAAVRPDTNATKATSLTSFGSMANLVKEAKAEGTLNVIALPKDWANYGTIIKDFEAKYGIKINDANPEGSSQDEINAVKELKGQSRAPDVLDMGTSFAIEAAKEKLLAPYKVKTWSDIPASAKAANGDWYADYGGYIAIGYNAKKVKVAPTSFKDLLKPEYKDEVGINGNPTEAGAAFAAVYAAALANGGSFANIEPGIQYFKKLKDEGNFVPVTASSSTVESGQTPIVIWWDYLEASEIASQVPGWKITIPTDASYAAYYDQAISAYAPHPAAARLWEEYLYSVTGQNLWLEGEARPIELPTLIKDGTVNKAAYAKLPKAPPGAVTFPTVAEETKAEDVVSQQWSSVLDG